MSDDWLWITIVGVGFLSLIGLWAYAWLDHQAECPRCRRMKDE